MSIELLKVKFGEQQLHDLDVMAKDMSESKRMNALYKKELHNHHSQGPDYNFQINVISRLFWPRFSTESIPAPGQVNS